MRHLTADDIGKKVFVYYNLNRKVWSVRHKGIVIGHTDTLRLDHVTLKVSEAGRQRVLREGRKNVHAGAYGTLSAIGDSQALPGGTPITYNPYKFSSFVISESHAPVHTCDVAYLTHRHVYVAGHIA